MQRIFSAQFCRPNTSLGADKDCERRYFARVKGLKLK